MVEGKASIIFDEIDLNILKTLNYPLKEKGEIRFGFRLTELTKKVDITHKSLRPHIDKLLQAKLITAWLNPEDDVVLYINDKSTANIENLILLFESVLDYKKNKNKMSSDLRAKTRIDKLKE